MKSLPIQTQFGAGVLTPRFFGRVDTPGYKAGVAELTNFTILRQGPADKRFGFNHLSLLPVGVTYARLLSFQVDNSSSYPVIVCDNGFLYVYDNGTLVSFAHLWTIDDIKGLQAAMQPGAPVMYIVSATKPTRKLALAASVFTFSVVAFTAPPALWTGSNHPAAIAFYQGRMWLAGTPGQGSSIWGSQSGAYENFTMGATASDALTYTIARRGTIQWISASADLVFGTENGEMIAKSEGGVLKTGDFDVKPQSSMGSRKAMSVQVGNKINFISPDGRKIYQMGYRWTDNGWIAQDLTFTSENITTGTRRAKELHWAQNPEQQMYIVCDDGHFFGATRDVENDIIGWYDHSTMGLVSSGTVLEVAGTSTFYMTVVRVLDGVSRMCLERVSTVHYLDGAEVVDSPTDLTTVTIARFANMTMTCTVDGAMHPPLVFDGAGLATLAFPGKVVIVGFSYSARLKTLPFATAGDGGSSASSRKRYNKIVVRLQDSKLPMINGERPAERSPSTPMDQTEPSVLLVDAVVENLGWDEFAQITIEQDLPVSCRVLALFGEINLETIG